MEQARSEHLRKTVTGACLVAAPALNLLAFAIHPGDETEAADQVALIAGGLDRWYWSHALMLVSLVLLVPAFLGLAHLLHERRPMAAFAGGGLAFAGLVAVAAVVGADGLAGYYIANTGGDAAVAIMDGVLEGGRMVPVYVATLLLGLGLLVIAVALYRTRVVAPWAAIALGLGAVLIDVGFPAGVYALVLAGMAALFVGMAPIGYAVLTESDEEWAHTPEFHGFGRAAPGAAV